MFTRILKMTKVNIYKMTGKQYERELHKKIRKVLKEQLDMIESLVQENKSIIEENKALREENDKMNEWGEEGVDWEWYNGEDQMQDNSRQDVAQVAQ